MDFVQFTLKCNDYLKKSMNSFSRIYVCCYITSLMIIAIPVYFWAVFAGSNFVWTFYIHLAALDKRYKEHLTANCT